MRDERLEAAGGSVGSERPMTATHPCVNALPLPEATTQLPPLSSAPVTTSQPRLAPHVYPIHPLRCRCLPRPTAPCRGVHTRPPQPGVVRTDPSAETCEPRGLGGSE
nr:unnamed protein product [Digitaria exilis]